MGKSKGSKGKDRKSKKAIEAEVLSLEEVLLLGGTKEDFEMLKGVSDEPRIGQDSQETSNDISEVKAFIKNLNIPQDSNVDADDSGGEDNQEDASVHVSPDCPTDIRNTRAKMLFTESDIWYDIQFDVPPCDSQAAPSRGWEKLVRQIADSVARRELHLFAQKNASRGSSEYQWQQTVIKGGTISDKLSALSLAITGCFIYGWQNLDTLVGLCQKKSPREAMLAIDTLKGIFMGTDSKVDAVLPSDRKLFFFNEQPGLSAMIHHLIARKVIKKDGKLSADLARIEVPYARTLLLWFLEDHVKRSYYAWIVALDTAAKSHVGNVKSRVVTHAWEMLVNKPEQERTLLTFLIKKLGDSERKVASKAVYLLLKLIEEHRDMKLPLVKEVETYLHQSGTSQRAQYYALVFCNQIPFRPKGRDSDCAQYLCRVYFRVFEQLSEKGVKDTAETDKMMNAVLTGISRAYPYAAAEDDSAVSKFFDENMTSLYRVVHQDSCSFKTSIQALHILYRLVFSEMKSEDGKTIETKVISESQVTRFYRALYATLSAIRTSDSSKVVGLNMNLVLRSLKNCPNPGVYFAIVKRLMQVNIAGILADNSALVAGSLVTLSESLADPKHRKLLPHFQAASTGAVRVPEEDIQETPESEVKQYDPYNRSPEFASAQSSCNWELAILAVHYHPTVSLFSKTLLDQSNGKYVKFIKYPSDPLEDFTITRFLDKFQYRNPKKDQDEGASRSVFGSSGGYKSKLTHSEMPLNRARMDPVSTEDWKQKMRRDKAAVPADDRFYAEYFALENPKKKKPRKSGTEEGDNDEIDGEWDGFGSGYEDEIEAAIVRSNPGNREDETIEEDDDVEFPEEEFSHAAGEPDVDEDELEEVELSEEEEEMYDDLDEDDADRLESGETSSDVESLGDADDGDLLFEESEDGEGVKSQKKQKNKKFKKGKVNVDEMLRAYTASSASKKKSKADLPVFASAEDYAHLLDTVETDRASNEAGDGKESRKRGPGSQYREGKKQKRNKVRHR